MNQASKNQAIDVPLGTVVTGKWHNHAYRIVKKLGAGACGTVYLANKGREQYAIKFSQNSSSITTEVNVLKSFQKVQGMHLGPSLIDVDDWIQPNGKQISFYVMEYLRGKELSTFIQKHGNEWVGILMVQLLKDLDELHNKGWVFGDLKSENLIVTYPPARLRWIDVGGTTQIGRAIKEYTEFYDRGYWGMGSRKAEPSYDLFALAMVMIHIYFPKRFEKGKHPEKTLMSRINQTQALHPYRGVLKKALYGQYKTSSEMSKEVTETLLNNNSERSRPKDKVKVQAKTAPLPSSKKTAPQPKVTRVQKRSTSRGKDSKYMLEGIGILVVVCMFYVLYIVMQWI